LLNMRLKKKYQNGGGVPGGDPIRKAEQLAFAQLLRDKAFQDKLAEKTRLRDEYGVYADDPAGLPSTDPFLALTAAGDVEAIGSGISEMAGGDLLTGGANVGIGMASVLLPGTLPKIKKVGKTTLTVDPNATFPNNPVVLKKDDATLGYMHEGDLTVGGESTIDMTISSSAARTASALREKEALEKALLADPNNVDLQTKLRRKESSIAAFSPPELASMAPDEITSEMAKGTMAMLQEIPVGKIVGAESVSTDSYPMMLKRWAKGQLSAKRFDDAGDNLKGLNTMGQKYRNSPEVEAWHRERYENNPDISGFDTDDVAWDNTFAPKSQMDYFEFVQVDPNAKAAYQSGNTARSKDLYERYMLQADNNMGVSSFGQTNSAGAKLDYDEAKELADVFNQRMRDLALDRPRLQEKGVARSKGKNKVVEDEGIPEAKVVHDPYNDRYLIQYPILPFHRNYNHGGKFKINKRRKPGMQVCR
jgi:hypothetical protein